MHDDDLYESIYEEWREFIQTGNYNKQVVRPEIAESWKRCMRANVDPYGGICTHLLTGNELTELLESNQELIEVSQPFLYKLYQFVRNSGFYVILTDSEGYILEFFGDRDMEEYASNINFMKGACWKEEYVGSTTMGIILHDTKPIMMSGAEHYCKKSQSFTCAAAPILNPDGELLGILDVSGPSTNAHKHTLGMVVAAVEAIQHTMTIREKNRALQAANEKMVNIFNTVSEAIIMFDGHKKVEMINPAAEKIIGKNFVSGKFLNDFITGNAYAEKLLMDDREFFDVESTLTTSYGKVESLISGVPIKSGNHITGMVTVIRPMDKVENLIKKYANHGVRLNFNDIIGESDAIKNSIQVAARAAGSDGTVLLQGESGTGKELFAQAIHNRSNRRKGPFVAINCGAIPRELVGSELFGYVEGAFTGASRGGRPGKFELASHGTIFLDEIGDMPLAQQVSLLRVLQERCIIRIGDNKEIPVDVRVICASNKSLYHEVQKGNFRQDLYYRLNVISIKIPPLRERESDIELLFRHMAKDMGQKSGYTMKEIDPEIFKYLKTYSWPGNVRELQNVVERMINISTSDTLSVSNLPEEILKNSQSFSEIRKDTGAIRVVEPAFDISVDDVRTKSKQSQEEEDRMLIQNLLIKYNGNITQVAIASNSSRNTIYRKMRKYNIKIT